MNGLPDFCKLLQKNLVLLLQLCSLQPQQQQQQQQQGLQQQQQQQQQQQHLQQ